MTLFLLALILSIPLAIVSNLLTLRFQKLWARRNATKKKRRIDAILLQTHRVRNYHDGPSSELISYAVRQAVSLLVEFSYAILLFVVGLGLLDYNGPRRAPVLLDNIFSLLAGINVFAITLHAVAIMRFLERVYRYESYMKESAEEVIRLRGANKAKPESEAIT
jgi:hypothetical protein